MYCGFVRAVLYFLVGIPVTLAGFLIVPIALRSRWTEEGSRPFSQYPEYGNWSRVRLPKYAYLWDNLFDGALGDKRGWWAKECRTVYGLPETDLKCMRIWLAQRNPANSWSRLVTGLDMSECAVVRVLGDAEVHEDKDYGFEWQLLCATRSDGKKFPRLYIVMPWLFRKDKAVLVDIGWKVKLSHNNTTKNAEPSARYKGSVFCISPWKGI